jgi:hypothetical protein
MFAYPGGETAMRQALSISTIALIGGLAFAARRSRSRRPGLALPVR